MARAAAAHAPDGRLERLRRRAVEALMAAALIAVLSLTVLGVPFVPALDRDAPPLRLLGLAILYGTGAVYFVLLALSVLHVRWTLLDVSIAVLLMSAAMPPLSWRRHGRRTPLHLVDLCALLTPIAFSIYATMVAVWEWDFWSIWGLKARVFFERGGIDWRFLESRWNLFVHPDYPLLVPFAYDFAALVNGGWSDRWLGVLFVAWAVAFLLVARELAGRELTPLAAALAGVVMSSAAISMFVGLAEGALIAYLGAGVLFIRRALLFDDTAAWRHGAILLGLAACTKNEGLAMIVSVAIAVAIVDARRVVRLWPAEAVALSSLVPRPPRAASAADRCPQGFVRRARIRGGDDLPASGEDHLSAVALGRHPIRPAGDAGRGARARALRAPGHARSTSRLHRRLLRHAARRGVAHPHVVDAADDAGRAAAGVRRDDRAS